MPTTRQIAALGCYIVASTLLVVTLRVGPDPGEPGAGVVQHTRLFEKYQATEPFVGVVVETYQATKPLRIAYDPVIKPRRAAPPDCARATRAVTGNSTYGRLNNALIALAHLLEFAATAPEPTVVVLPDHVKEWVPETEFNYSSALRRWVCVTDAPPNGLRVEQADLRDIYWWAAGPTTNFGVTGLRSHSAELKGLILAQIVMRPQPGLRALVARASPKGPSVAARKPARLTLRAGRRYAQVRRDPPAQLGRHLRRTATVGGRRGPARHGARHGSRRDGGGPVLHVRGVRQGRPPDGRRAAGLAHHLNN